MLGVVIGYRVAWAVEKGCPHSFKHNGGWYVWDKDYRVAVEYYENKKGEKHVAD